MIKKRRCVNLKTNKTKDFQKERRKENFGTICENFFFVLFWQHFELPNFMTTKVSSECSRKVRFEGRLSIGKH